MRIWPLLPLILFASSALAAQQMAGEAKPPASEARQPATLVGDEPQRPVEQVRAAIRAEAQRLYGEECGTVTLPDRAIVPVEVTGGGLPEYLVLFGRGICEVDGGSGRWLGSGGAVVQFWLASGGPPRMLLEHQMHGFTTREDGLVSDQHGGFCPGGAGPSACLVFYRWNERDRTLEVVERRYYDGATPEQPPRMQWGYEQISR